MSFNRYTDSPRLNLGTQHGTANAVSLIRYGIKIGAIPIVGKLITTGFDRLDVLAGKSYGDSTLWWLLAAASDIGWGLQVPPNTVINLVRLTDINKIVGI